MPIARPTMMGPSMLSCERVEYTVIVSDDNAEVDPHGLYDLNRQILTCVNIFVRGGIPNHDALSQSDGRESGKEDETRELHRRSKSLLGRRGIQTQEPDLYTASLLGAGIVHLQCEGCLHPHGAEAPLNGSHGSFLVEFKEIGRDLHVFQIRVRELCCSLPKTIPILESPTDNGCNVDGSSDMVGIWEI
jgi:hypothetical protein